MMGTKKTKKLIRESVGRGQAGVQGMTEGWVGVFWRTPSRGSLQKGSFYWEEKRGSAGKGEKE